MAKLKKSQLKGIVKECLVEILSEGIHIDSENKKSASNSKNTQRARSSSLDNIRFGQSRARSDELEENTSRVVSSMTEDPILSSILKDTAKTTLQEQRMAEAGRSVQPGNYKDVAASTVSSNSPEDLFGESASKWAQLAFADTVPRK